MSEPISEAEEYFRRRGREYFEDFVRRYGEPEPLRRGVAVGDIPGAVNGRFGGGRVDVLASRDETEKRITERIDVLNLGSDLIANGTRVMICENGDENYVDPIL